MALVGSAGVHCCLIDGLCECLAQQLCGPGCSSGPACPSLASSLIRWLPCELKGLPPVLELHQFRQSAFCLKVRMVLQAKGLSCRTVDVTEDRTGCSVSSRSEAGACPWMDVVLAILRRLPVILKIALRPSADPFGSSLGSPGASH